MLADTILTHIERIDIWIRELYDLYRGTDRDRLEDARAMREAAGSLREAWRSAPNVDHLKREDRVAFSHTVRTHVNTIIGFSHPDTLQLYQDAVSSRERLYYGDIHKLGQIILEKVNSYFEY